MDGIHDLGGMQGFGPIQVRTGNVPFAELKMWEKRMWALSRHTLAPNITIDWFRHGIERMVPSDYLSFAYFNKWCTNYLMLMIDNGTITLEDVRRGHVENPDPPAVPVNVDDTLAINSAATVSFAVEPQSDPAFEIGQQVATRRVVAAAHTRLPRYARGARGTIVSHHGCHLFPDEGAKGIKTGEHLYTVAFPATTLWGDEADPRDDVTLDLWESYLVPA
jgi:nitrile hydratase subunit beta